MTPFFTIFMAVAVAVVIGQVVKGEIWFRRPLFGTQVSRRENPGSFWLEIAYQAFVLLAVIALKLWPHLFGSK